MFTHLRAAATTVAMLPAPAAAVPLTLTQALALALQRSEATRSARAGVASASQAARASGQLPVTGADRFSATRDSMAMKRIGIGQEWVSARRSWRRNATSAD